MSAQGGKLYKILAEALPRQSLFLTPTQLSRYPIPELVTALVWQTRQIANRTEYKFAIPLHTTENDIFYGAINCPFPVKLNHFFCANEHFGFQWLQTIGYLPSDSQIEDLKVTSASSFQKIETLKKQISLYYRPW